MPRMVAVHGSAREMMIMAVKFLYGLLDNDALNVEPRYSAYEKRQEPIENYDDYMLTEIYNELYDKVYSA